MKKITVLVFTHLLAAMAIAALVFCFRAAALPSTVRGATAQNTAGQLGPYTVTDQLDSVQRLTFDGRSVPLAWTNDRTTLLIQRPGRVVDRQQLFELWALSLQDKREWQISDNAAYPSIHDEHVAYLYFAGQEKWAAAVSTLTPSEQIWLGIAQWRFPPTWVGQNVLIAQQTGRLTAYGDKPETARVFERPLGQMRARLSSDGQFVATTDGHTLWVDDDETRRAVTTADHILGFAWSPVENKLAYILSLDGPTCELWVWDREMSQSSLLARQKMAHLDEPVWSPDGDRIAFVRHATGNGLNAAGDIWLVYANGTGLRPMAQTPVDEGSPVWSPDGHTLAFSLSGDVWLANLRNSDLDATLRAAIQPILRQDDLETALPSATPLNLSAPLTIRVKHDENNWCRDVPLGQIDVYTLEQYVKQVVPHEVYASSWHTESLKAQAVAARTYAWKMIQQNASDEFDVWDSGKSQYMCDDTHVRTNLAVDETQGQYVSYNGNVIYAFFCAETGTPTNYKNEFNLDLAPYLRPIYDPVSLWQTRDGHSWGMSQWGMQRWASLYEWNYQQILEHYYSLATVEYASPVTRPLGTIVLPWNNVTLNTDYVTLQAQASGANTPLTVTFSARISKTWTTIYTDVAADNSRGYVWPVSTYSDTVTPSIGLRLTLVDPAGQAVTSTISQIGLDRVAPTGTVTISPSTVTTLSVSVELTATDPPPGGKVRVSLRNDDWQWQDTDFYTTAGKIISDSTAVDGYAWYIAQGEHGTLFGSDTPLLPAGQYRAYFRLKVPTGTITNSLEVLKLDVTSGDGSELLGIRYVRGTDFRAGDVYQEIAVDFELLSAEIPNEFRVESYGLTDLWLDRVQIFSYPQTISPRADWTLPAREGIVTVTAAFVDRAENVSAGVPLTLAITDMDPPEGWREFSCTRSTCTVQVYDVIAGLSVNSALYHYSTDGGVTWSEWISATCSGTDGSRRWETVTAANIPFALTTSEDRYLQFGIRDIAEAGNWSTSAPCKFLMWSIYLPLVSKQ
ncbi:MAG: SpoIID/LytB domain-containing protein [Anaerolineae bacterium]|nr:SpoIID/LytB domain-containing protein [Anaerolineae bacterium]